LKAPWLEIIGDQHNLRILVALRGGSPRTLYSISKETGIYPRTLRARLRVLMGRGIVVEERLGEIRIHRLDQGALPVEVKTLLGWLGAQIEGEDATST